MELDLRKYGTFISEFRHAFGIGRPADANAQIVGPDGRPHVDVSCGSNYFRFRVSDFYMLYTSHDGRTWNHLVNHNYSRMSLSDGFHISGRGIVAAFSGPRPPTSGNALAMCIVATAEAARSKVVAFIVQRMLQDHRLSLPWTALEPLLIGSWSHNTQGDHKTRPVQYGALGVRDYYNTKAKNALSHIAGSGLGTNFL